MKDSLGMRGKKLTITCPNCSKKFQELIARLDDQDEIDIIVDDCLLTGELLVEL